MRSEDRLLFFSPCIYMTLILLACSVCEPFLLCVGKSLDILRTNKGIFSNWPQSGRPAEIRETNRAVKCCIQLEV